VVKIVVCGALGRMGRRIIELSVEDPLVDVVGGVERSERIVSTDLGDAIGRDELRRRPLTDNLGDVLRACDVVVEFSGSPRAAVSYTEIATERGKGVVIGTTGFSDEDIKTIEECSHKAPVLLSPNMSLGINLLFRLVRIAAEVLKDRGFDVEIMEIHHRFKKDAPSGTAVRLSQILQEAAGLGRVVYGRHGESPRGDGELGVMALRGGDVVGDHTVYFLGNGERIELTHRASSRDTFARGALEAAKWLKGKEAGLYSMFDVLGL